MSIFFLVIDLALYNIHLNSSDEFQNTGENTLSRKSITLAFITERNLINNQVHIKDVRLDSLVGILVSGPVPIEKTYPLIVFSGAVSSNFRRQSTTETGKDSRGRTVNKYSQSTK